MSIVGDIADDVIHDIDPIKVQIVGDDTNREEAAQFTSWSTFYVTGIAGEQMTQILPQAPLRSRATIRILSGLTGNTTGAVIIGRRNTVPQRQGATWPANSTFTYEGAGDVWIIGDGASHDFVVSVIDERYSENQ